MSENKLISPMLDNFDVGGPISDHNGVYCYPAMRKNSDERYIVKSVSIPASQTQLDALLLTGAYPDAAAALTYFQELTDGTVDELETLKHLSQLEGFLPYEDWQVVPKEDSIGFDVYMISPYRRTLRKHFQRQGMTHLMAVNLGLDLCAALSVSRRCGYLYVDLKPNNIYVINEQEYRIGDLGFIKLNSLKYATVTDKYRSAYSAPEIHDTFATLNTTVDIYAAGLILYQAYNGGELPFTGDVAPAEKFDAPLYADYEMSEIILKACDPNPENRWQDPIEMGQAIVSYMQRNGANDTPIITAIPKTVTEEMVTDVESLLTSDDIDLSDIDMSDIPELDSYEETEIAEADAEEQHEDAQEQPEDTQEESEDTADQVQSDELQENVQEPDASEYAEDDFGNLSFLEETTSDETSPENTLTEVTYEEISDELTEILSQADELVAHPVPDPVVSPDAIDLDQIQIEEPQVQIEDPIEQEDSPEEIEEVPQQELSQETSEETVPEDSDLDIDQENSEPEVSDDTIVKPAFEVPAEEDEEVAAAIAETLREDEDSCEDTADDSSDDTDGETEKKSSNHVLRNIIIFLLIAIVAVAGFLYYQYIYLQPIYSIKVDGDESSMVVLVDSDTDEALLSVVCSDAHGNQLSAPVTNGVATFANLAPDTAYNVRVVVDGFHKLTGETAVSYTTPAQTNIVQFTAVTGAEEGTAIVSFTVEGPDSGNWTLTYKAADEEEKSIPMLSHMATINDLTIGKEYTFTLVPGEDMYVIGTTETSYVASTVLSANEVSIVSCVDNKLTAVWTVPADTTVSGWTVRCYNDGSYNETIITSETTAVFEGVDPASAHTVDVIASGQSVSQRAYMAANAVTVSDFQADTSNIGQIDLSWNSSSAPEGGWVLLYTIEGMQTQGTVTCKENKAQIKPMVPGATYSFTLQQANGDAVLTQPLSCETPDAQDFSGYGMTRNTMDYALCRRPNGDWEWDDIPSSDYTSTFSVGEKISMVGNLQTKSSISDDIITALFVFRDSEGNVVCYGFQDRSWRNMWSQSYGEFDIPQAPAEAGNYTLSIYFNGKLVTEKNVTIK